MTHKAYSPKSIMTSNQNPQELRNPELAVDKSEVNLKAIMLFGGLLVIACLVAMSILAGLFSFYYHREAGLDQRASPLVPSGTRTLPPEPRLQLAPGHEIHPLKDLAAYRQREDALIANYGWVNQPAGVVRIPVEEAKKLLLARGLPVRSAGESSGALETYESVRQLPTASSAGRVNQKEY